MSDEQNLKALPLKEYLPYTVAILALVLVVFLSVLSFNFARQSQFIGKSAEFQKTVAISGVGKVFAKPDIGQVDLSVLAEAKTVTAAVSENNKKMNNIIAEMKGLNVADEDLKTVNYSISPRYQYDKGRSTILGYEVSQTLQVKIRDLDKVGSILEKSAAVGANQVGSLVFTFDDMEKIREEARQKAIENAKLKATDLAAFLGVSLGRIVGFDESGNSGMSMSSYEYREEYGVGGGAAPDIQTGQNEVGINVTLVYELR